MLSSARRLISALLVLSIGVTGMFAEPSNQTEPTGVTVGSVESFHPVAGPARTSAYLSPDGTRYAYKNETICIYTIAGEELVCTPDDEESRDVLARVDNETVRWSPDGRWLVMTQNALVYLTDSDLWVVDTESGALTNVTDDGYDDSIFPASDVPPSVVVDLAPRWLPDGRIVFIRYQQSFGAPEAYAVSPEGGEAERLGQLSDLDVFPAYVLDVSPDGEQLAYNIYSREEGESGVWVYDIAADQPEHVLETEAPLSPFVTEYSADGRYLLTNDARFASQRGSPDDESPIRVIDLETGKRFEVDDRFLVLAAGWSPDGSGMLYIVRDVLHVENSGLYYTPSPGEYGELILEGFRLMPPTSRSMQAIEWGVNDVILLSDYDENQLLVIQLERE